MNARQVGMNEGLMERGRQRGGFGRRCLDFLFLPVLFSSFLAAGRERGGGMGGATGGRGGRRYAQLLLGYD